MQTSSHAFSALWGFDKIDDGIDSNDKYPRHRACTPHQAAGADKGANDAARRSSTFQMQERRRFDAVDRLFPRFRTTRGRPPPQRPYQPRRQTSAQRRRTAFAADNKKTRRREKSFDSRSLVSLACSRGRPVRPGQPEAPLRRRPRRSVCRPPISQPRLPKPPTASASPPACARERRSKKLTSSLPLVSLRSPASGRRAKVRELPPFRGGRGGDGGAWRGASQYDSHRAAFPVSSPAVLFPSLGRSGPGSLRDFGRGLPGWRRRAGVGGCVRMSLPPACARPPVPAERGAGGFSTVCWFVVCC